MLPLPTGREASSGVVAPPYVRHRPERTLLYQLIEEYYPAFKVHLATQDTALPGYVEQEFEDHLKCGRLEHGFLRLRIAPSDFVEPLDFVARLAALVPKPRVNLARFHGVFAPNNKHRARVTPAKRGRGGQRTTTADLDEPTPARQWWRLAWWPARAEMRSSGAMVGRVQGLRG